MESLTAAALLGLAFSQVPASMQLVIPLAGDAERRIVKYQCEGVETPFAVEYINAQPNFLALVPVGGAQIVFVAAVSADGGRYVSGPFEWWTRGTDATFTDTRDATEPVACGEMLETP